MTRAVAPTSPAAPADPASQVPIPQLADIHLPDPVGLWPPAPGWWLLSAAALAVLLIALLKLRARYRRNAYRRAARSALLQAWQVYQSDSDGGRYLRTFNQLLKRTALAGYPRESVAGLSGAAWVDFLAATADGLPQSAKTLLQAAPYRPATAAADAAELARIHQLGLDWIKRHRRSAEPADA